MTLYDCGPLVEIGVGGEAGVYTPPAGNDVDFTLGGSYAAPAGDDVDISFEDIGEYFVFGQKTGSTFKFGVD